MRNATVKLRAVIVLAFALSGLALADDARSTSQGFEFKPPLGIPFDVWSYFVPRDNPLTAAKIDLGRQLFFDPRLSIDGSVSCSTCHDPESAFTDGKNFSEGVKGKRGARNSPSLLNAMFNSGQFWDGRAASLEEQARLPLINSVEMGNESLDQVVARLQNVPEYQTRFKAAFGGPITIDLIAKAIASFERTLVSGNSAFDRFTAGDRQAMSEAAQRGFFVFRARARCAVCHNFNPAFPFFTDQNYRNTGIAANNQAFVPLTRRALKMGRNAGAEDLKSLVEQEGASELGRFGVTGNPLDIGAFRTPSLRNVELTAPYFHDGSARSLEDVVDFYVKGGNDNPARDWELQPLDLSDAERSDLIEFLKSLTGDDARKLVEAGANKTQARAAK